MDCMIINILFQKVDNRDIIFKLLQSYVIGNIRGHNITQEG